MRTASIAMLVACACTAGAAQAQQQPYPAKPVRLVVPFAPGGGVDATARVLSKKLSETWGQQMIIDNRPGAGANIGAEIVARAVPDGYTLMLTNNALAISAGLYPKLPYNAMTDFAAVTQVLASPFVLVVPANSPFKTVKDLVAAAKAKPDEIAYASAGVGSGPHLAAVLFNRVTGTSMNHVPFKSGGAALPDVIAGRVQLIFTTPLAAVPHINGNRLRALGVSTRQRFSGLPNVPTIIESGVPNFETVTWYMVLAPVKVPPALVNKIQADIAAALKQPDVIKVLGSDSELVGSTPKEASELLKREVAQWSRIVKEAGVKPTD